MCDEGSFYRQHHPSMLHSNFSHMSFLSTRSSSPPSSEHCRSWGISIASLDISHTERRKSKRGLPWRTVHCRLFSKKRVSRQRTSVIVSPFCPNWGIRTFLAQENYFICGRHTHTKRIHEVRLQKKWELVIVCLVGESIVCLECINSIINACIYSCVVLLTCEFGSSGGRGNYTSSVENNYLKCNGLV